MYLSSLTEIIWAVSMSHHVDSRFPQRGGLFLVAPPGQLKTAIMSAVQNVAGVKSLSDMTTNDLKRIRDEIASGHVNTLLFLDFQKLFERRIETAQNILGNIRALVDEGYTGTTEDTNQELNARCQVIAALTPAFKRRYWESWVDCGMARRIVVSLFRLENPRLITQAVVNDQPYNLGSGSTKMEPLTKVPLRIDEGESKQLLQWLAHQAGKDTPLVLLKKVVSILRWKYKQEHRPDRAMEIMKDFSQSLGPHGAQLEIDV